MKSLILTAGAIGLVLGLSIAAPKAQVNTDANTIDAIEQLEGQF